MLCLVVQQQLFSIKPAAAQVPGFRLREGYLTTSEESQLLEHIDQQPWRNDWRRRIQVYGVSYGSPRDTTTAQSLPFPPWLQTVAERVAAEPEFHRIPENCVINEYIPPLGIGSHKDFPQFGPVVACVSLASDIVMELRHPARDERIEILVPRRSLWMLGGEARSDWEHGIPARLTDVIHGVKQPRERRVSVTFRTLLTVSQESASAPSELK
ncbi:MAG TPA: alpha-ketoglutarate-dependent dioxygenase AlkB [Methylomirabilota bacterium]|nr:alpha-ketoglutarate-dependent dioxygenase AlkB [Methylomirabilota bacterium]